MSTLKVDTIQSRQHSSSTISLTSTGATVNGDCTATTFSGSGASLTSLPAANLTGTLPALSAANLTSIPAANITGTLPAIDGSALTGVSITHPAWFGNIAANQTGIPDTTWTTITNLTDESVNPSSNSGGWDSSTGVYTVQSGQAGIYYAFGGVLLDDLNAGEILLAGISKNDANPTLFSEGRTNYGTARNTYTSMAQVISLAVGDTVRFKVYHNEGSTETALADNTHFGGFRIFAT